MRIGIISKYYKNYNYGGLLQSYALVKVLDNLGYEAKQISFKPNDRKKYGVKNYFLLYAKSWVKSGILHFRHIYIKSFNTRMIEFMRSIPHTKSVTENNVYDLNTDFDAFIAGSDQIWNPAFAYNEYFLNFADKSKKKISYAASIGVIDCNQDELEYLKKGIGSFDFISLREYEGKKLVKKILPDRQVEWVLDPTFLLNKSDWSELDVSDSMNLPKRYAVVYLMGNNPNNEQLVRKIIDSLSIEAIVIPFTFSDYMKSKRNLVDLGPKEFVTLIKHATVVFTDSFHATSFSIINEVNFYCLNRSGEVSEKSMNSRIDSLFRLLEIKPRWIRNFDEYESLDRDIDFTVVEKLIEKYRAESLKFLCDALDNN